MSDAFDADDFDAALEWDDEVDAIIEEIWEIRRKMWEEFDNDPHKMSAHMMKRHADRVAQGHPELKSSSSPEEEARIIAACQALLREHEAQEQSPEAHAPQ
ncbi:MAG TPA: hypothetical protein VGB24_20735 [Longimicrobium sp.]|jgi:hypothetical protein|uniref:hypothetical protein n=1 Tax=Longimicrobium sp. TaxID=2029185 RepID=UPI002ED8580A